MRRTLCKHVITNPGVKTTLYNWSFFGTAGIFGDFSNKIVLFCLNFEISTGSRLARWLREQVVVTGGVLE